MQEIFKDIPNYEGIYQVSNLGRVKSLKRWCTAGRSGYFKKECILKPGDGRYLVVTLAKNNIVKTRTIHQLVAMAFLNHTADGCRIHIDHIDGDKQNNTANNLQVLTARQHSTKTFNNIKTSSKYVGVSWFSRDENWRSHIRIEGKLKYLGSFKNEIDASNAYQDALNKIL